MNKTIIKTLALTSFVALAMSGCVADGPTSGNAEITKDEARAANGKNDHGFDFCELFGWYGDGECDEFCPEPDPDCAPDGACRTDRDCPTINCIVAPCPTNTCVAGECVIDNPSDDCPAGERACTTCTDATVCAPSGVSCPLYECPPPGVVCGGRTGERCDADEYCSFAPDAICGRADATGTCTPRGGPICPANYAPVCGCDGETYSNACQASAAGVSVDFTGECDPEPEPACLVGGCSSQTCYEEGGPGAISTCEFRPEYACYSSAACERQDDGACGWTETPELTECVDQAACSTVRCGYGTRCQVCDNGAPGCFLPGEECPSDVDPPVSCAAVFCGYGTRCEVCDGAAACYLPGEGCE